MKDTITDNKTGESQTYFMGVDGYVQTAPNFCDGYKRKGNATNNIKRGIEFCEHFHKDTTNARETTNEKGETIFIYNESERWTHHAQVIEIDR